MNSDRGVNLHGESDSRNRRDKTYSIPILFEPQPEIVLYLPIHFSQCFSSVINNYNKVPYGDPYSRGTYKPMVKMDITG